MLFQKVSDQEQQAREHAKQLKTSENARIDSEAKVRELQTKIAGLEAYQAEREKRLS